jgi:two-component system, NarL family, response regulator NreC
MRTIRQAGPAMYGAGSPDTADAISLTDPFPPRRQRIDSGSLYGPWSTTASAGYGGSTIEVVLGYEGTLMRSGLRVLLDDTEDLEVVAEAEDIEGALRYVRGHHPGVLVLDLDLERPERPLIEAILHIRAHMPDVAVVVVSHKHSSSQVRDAVAAGALGCVPSTATADQLVEAIRRADSGEAYLPAEVLNAIATPAKGGPDGLTHREVGIVGLIAMGYTNVEIAELLFISVRTIESHRARIQMKLGGLTRSELVAYALEHGMTKEQAVMGAVQAHARKSPTGEPRAPAPAFR